MKTERGQVMIIVGITTVVMLFFVAVLIDGARLYIEKQEINRALDAAGKAGLIVVGDRMVTQVVAAQTAAAAITPGTEVNGETPGPTSTQTPRLDDFYAWITDEDRQTLVAPPIQTQVAVQVLGSLEENGFGGNNPNLITLNITYPDSYHADHQSLAITLELERRVVILFGKILDLSQGVLSGSTKQTIPQR